MKNLILQLAQGIKAKIGASFDAARVQIALVLMGIKVPRFEFDVECLDASGNLKWRERIFNLVTTAGKTDIIDKYFKGSAYTAAWYLGLKGTGTAAVGDTAASHAGWAEVNPYTGNRPAIAFGTTSGGSNTAAAASFSITVAGPTTVAGAFVQSANTGTTGILYSAADFAVARSVVSGDTLNVTPTVSAT
jgi:hypothetical protein